MDINGGADCPRAIEFGKSPCCSGVIEMDVTEKYMPDVSGGEADLAQFGGYVFKGRCRSRIKKHESVVRLHRGGGDDAGPAEVPGVENMDH